MQTLTFYIKSGNNFRIRFVKNWEIEVKGNKIVSLMLERAKFFDWMLFWDSSPALQGGFP